MNTRIRPSIADVLIHHFDRSLKTLIPGSNKASEPSPSESQVEASLTETQRRHIAGLMRVNHTGEVCAQGLYKGQALTAKLPQQYDAMEAAADEEIDHLVWCEERLKQLESRPSLLNPAWYALSYSLGAFAGAMGDKYSLGFVAATEQQVCKHLESHLKQIKTLDPKSSAIIERMKTDEERHANHALKAGGILFNDSTQNIMAKVAKLMTKSSYRI